VVNNKLYLMFCACLTGIFYILTGIQYWVSDYMINEMGQPESKVFITFGIVSITGPVVGVIVGGNITTALGGYTTKKSLYATVGMAYMTMFSAVPIPFVNSFEVVVALLWLLLFFGGAILPSCTGLMLNTVDITKKTTANSLANLSYNMFGTLPAPFIYGAIYDFGDGGHG